MKSCPYSSKGVWCLLEFCSCVSLKGLLPSQEMKGGLVFAGLGWGLVVLGLACEWRTRIEEWSLKGDWGGKEKIQITLLLHNRFALLEKEDCWHLFWKWDSSCIVYSWVLQIWGEGGSLQVWPGMNPLFVGCLLLPALSCTAPALVFWKSPADVARQRCLCWELMWTPEPLVPLESLWWVQDLGPVSCQAEGAKEQRCASVLFWEVCWSSTAA